MTDDSTWQAPGGEPQQPGWAPPGSQPYGQPTGQPAGPPPGFPGQPTWTPPPKPGLIPLRPLSFGTILGASFQVMRRNPRPTLGVSLLLYGAVNLIIYFSFGALVGYYFLAITNAQDEDLEAFVSGGLLAAILAPILPLALSIVVSAILQGIISLEVARGTVGEKLRLRGIWRLARGRIGALIGWTLLLSGVLLVATTLVVVALFVIAFAGGVAGVLIAVLLGIVLFLGLLALWLWIDTKLCLVPSILLLERLTLRAAIVRSWQLTRGFFWKTLGIRLLVNVMISVALQVITTPISLLATYGGLLINPNGDPDATVFIWTIVGAAITGLISIFFGAVGLIMGSAVVALIYIDIRMRREGLDLELLRFVEARQAGDSSVGDPYLRSPAETPPPAAAGSPWA